MSGSRDKRLFLDRQFKLTSGKKWEHYPLKGKKKNCMQASISFFGGILGTSFTTRWETYFLCLLFPALHKIPWFRQISWCKNFVEVHSFWGVSAESKLIEILVLYSVWMRENTDPRNCEYRHFSRSEVTIVYCYSELRNI